MTLHASRSHNRVNPSAYRKPVRGPTSGYLYDITPVDVCHRPRHWTCVMGLYIRYLSGTHPMDICKCMFIRTLLMTICPGPEVVSSPPLHLPRTTALDVSTAVIIALNAAHRMRDSTNTAYSIKEHAKATAVTLNAGDYSSSSMYRRPASPL